MSSVLGRFPLNDDQPIDEFRVELQAWLDAADAPNPKEMASHGGRSREDALLIERTLPFGMPEDQKERMNPERRANPKGRNA